MSFWDSSALVPLLTDEPRSQAVRNLAMREGETIVWWGAEVECASALARLERAAAGAIDFEPGYRALRELAAGWVVISPGPAVKSAALRLLRLHPLRAADALQLGAAVVAARGAADRLPFVTLDDHLAAAARREGFDVAMPELA